MGIQHEKTKRLLGSGELLLRGLFLFFSLAGLLTLWVWTARKDLVERIDRRVLSAYEARYNSRFERAASLLRASKVEEAKKELEGLAASLSDVHKLDTLTPVYTRTLGTLLSVAVEEKEMEKALAYAKALVDFDPRAYSFWLNYAYVLDNNGRRDEAVKAFYEAYSLAPQSLQAASSLAKALSYSGKTAEAKEVLKGYMEANRGAQVYAYYAGPGEGFTEQKMGGATIAITGRPQSFSMPVKGPGIEKVRIDFLGLLDMNVEFVSFTLVTDEGGQRFTPGDIVLSTAGLSRTGPNTYAMTGKGEFKVGFAMPQELRGAALKAVEVEAALTAQAPEGLNISGSGA